MKTLFILRHGKAAHDSPGGGDRERPLTPRGEQDAAAVGATIRSLVGVPDIIVASDAERARATAGIVAEATGYGHPVAIKRSIYEADIDTLFRIVRHLPVHARTAVLVGHNPGLEGLADRLVGPGAAFWNLPPAGLVHISLDTARWLDIEPESGVLVGLHRPPVPGRPSPGG